MSKTLLTYEVIARLGERGVDPVDGLVRLFEDGLVIVHLHQPHGGYTRTDVITIIQQLAEVVRKMVLEGEFVEPSASSERPSADKCWVIRRGDRYYYGHTPDIRNWWCDNSRSALKYCMEGAARRQASELLGMGYHTVVEEYGS